MKTSTRKKLRKKFGKRLIDVVTEINQRGFDITIASRLENDTPYHIPKKHADAYDAYLRALKKKG